MSSVIHYTPLRPDTASRIFFRNILDETDGPNTKRRHL
uniref:Uncharacterized protein n=1 Tax=Lepeophtheirus salmonis TaxID=72036 RepID=A0A0K2UTR1_LEPSM